MALVQKGVVQLGVVELGAVQIGVDLSLDAEKDHWETKI